MKKPFYKKWWFWVIVVLFIIGGLNSKGSETEQASTNSTDAVAKTTTAVTTPEKKAVPKAEPKKEEAPKMAKIGEAVQVGNLAVQANKANSKNTIGQNEYLQKKTADKYIVINLSIKNLDKEARTLDSSMFKLIDAAGLEYEPMTDADLYVNDSGNMLFLAKINPGLTKTANVVFEVPKDSKNFKLQADSGIGWEAGNRELIDIGK
ncbi:Telomeric repeat-binding factor 2 [compost metagenome]